MSETLKEFLGAPLPKGGSLGENTYHKNALSNFNLLNHQPNRHNKRCDPTDKRHKCAVAVQFDTNCRLTTGGWSKWRYTSHFDIITTIKRQGKGVTLKIKLNYTHTHTHTHKYTP